MKKAFFFFFTVFLFSACSDFYHLQYKKLKKVPASGLVAPREHVARNNFATEQNPEIKNGTLVESKVVSKYNLPEEPFIQAKSSEKNKIENKSVGRKSAEKSAKKRKADQLERKSVKKFDGQVLLVILILLLALFLIVGGGIILAIGISIGYWVPVLVGALLIFLGIWPVLGFIGFIAAGDRYHPVENYGDKQQ